MNQPNHTQRIGVGVFIEKDGKALIVKRSLEDDIFPGVWELPGGVEFGESAEDAAVREAFRRCGR